MERKTPLYDCHVKYGGKMVSFAGYLLPVQYETGVVREHMAVRTACGLFDVSHMGEILLEGPDALLNVQNLVTNDCAGMTDGQARYTPMCSEEGFVLDDLLVYRLSRGKLPDCGETLRTGKGLCMDQIPFVRPGFLRRPFPMKRRSLQSQGPHRRRF
jgi:hypothetical protein